MFKKILIANRGEIACRVIKTAKILGIKTVAVYSEIDAQALHVKMADESYCIGRASAKETYLNIDKIIEVAQLSNAQAIHPGYGFLAENADFAKRCEQAGIIFIGPSPAAIESMGNKVLAKKFAIDLGIPLVPGYQGEQQDLETLQIEASKIGIPLLIKAAAGGGGKGMRLVHDLKELNDALKSAKREANASFGNDAVFIEKYLAKSRHVETQILCDKHGHVLFLFDRDCSTQRRHQKIIEEAPAPHLSDTLRKKMAESSIKLAKGMNYVNAGTIEFLVDENENYYFMEMNTRLQVEHPVTEMITGLDLVEWQIRIAAGETLSLNQSEVTHKGHAFEARIYAEDPAADYKPSTGKLEFFNQPQTSAAVRIDTGVTQNDSITVYYDSLLAKLVVFGNDRKEALKKLEENLEKFVIVGVKTNLPLLYQVTTHIDFQSEKIHTNFVNQHPELFKSAMDQNKDYKDYAEKIIAGASVIYFENIKNNTLQLAKHSEDSNSPWFKHDGWKILGTTSVSIRFWFNHQLTTVVINPNPISEGTYLAIISDSDKEHSIRILDSQQYTVHLQVDGETLALRYIIHDDRLHIFYRAEHTIFDLKNPLIHEDAQEGGETRLTSPMPGTVVEVLIKPGQHVSKGDKLLVLEAMKMEHAFTAPADGIIKSIFFKVGDTINEGVNLLELETENL